MFKNILFIFLFSFSIAQAKIYDCFLFLNEWEILEIRLNEMYEHVDAFVLVEAAETFRTGASKPFYFEEEKHRFEKFADKIIHIKLEERIETNDVWERQYWQRNQIMRGLKDCQPEDLILISDVDEIIPGRFLPTLYSLSEKHPIIGFRQKMYRWFLNRSTESLWAGTAALRYKDLIKLTPEEVRNKVRHEEVKMYRLGWHFTSMGGYDRAVVKYNSISGGKDGFLSHEEWAGQVDAHPLVSIDSTFPKYIFEHQGKFKEQQLIDTR